MRDYIDYVLNKAKRPYSFDEIIMRIEEYISERVGYPYHLSDDEKNEVLEVLNLGVNDYEYILINSKYASIMKTPYRKGRFYANKSGSGNVSVTISYVNRDGILDVHQEEYSISSSYANGAIDGDFVLVDISSLPKIVKVLDRNLDYVSGEVYRVGNAYYVKPSDPKKKNIIIALNGEAIEGTRVEVRLDQQTAPSFYIGTIVHTFNHKDDPNEDILWEAQRMGVDNEFSPASLEQLRHIPDEVRDTDRVGRVDETGEVTFTIDGADTKDMDDSVGLYINERGNYVLRVDITDIPSLIPYNSPLDRDGFRKGNSYYPGGVVFPNYPRKISNGIGSLNPRDDRLTITDLLEITPDGEVVDYRYYPSIIRSRMQMTYDKVNDILNNNIIDSDYSPYADMLRLMDRLASILHRKRIEDGACEFNRPEPKGVYSSNGHMTGVKLRYQGRAEKIIEEFMLIANDYRARYFNKMGVPCIYRVHDQPNVEKLQNYLGMLEAIGIPFNLASAEELACNPKMFQKLIAHVSNRGYLTSMLNTELIKTLSRARYSVNNIGHNGLAKPYYLHGTSPARRYVDKTEENIAWDCIFMPDPTGKKRNIWKTRLPEIVDRANYTEKLADDLESEVFRMQTAESMSQFIGQEFEATIVSVSGNCILVQLDNLIQGIVNIGDLDGDYYLSENGYSLVSLDDKDDYHIGDRLLLRLKSSSKETKKIEFKVIEKVISVHDYISGKSRIDAKTKVKN